VFGLVVIHPNVAGNRLIEVLTTIRARCSHGVEEITLDRAGITDLPSNGDLVNCFGGVAVVQACEIYETGEGNRSVLLDVEIRSGKHRIHDLVHRFNRLSRGGFQPKRVTGAIVDLVSRKS